MRERDARRPAPDFDASCGPGARPLVKTMVSARGRSVLEHATDRGDEYPYRRVRAWSAYRPRNSLGSTPTLRFDANFSKGDEGQLGFVSFPAVRVDGSHLE